MRTELLAVHRGEMGFGQFARTTEKRWYGMARMMLNRWEAPPGVSLEDLVQELLLGCWRALPKWDPRRGPIDSYIRWMAMTAAKRWLNAQRGVDTSRGDNWPTRHPIIPLTPVDEAPVEVDGLQEWTVDALGAIDCALQRLQSRCEQMALMAVVHTGSVEQAAALLFERREVRQRFKLGSEKQTRRMVLEAIREAAQEAERWRQDV